MHGIAPAPKRRVRALFPGVGAILKEDTIASKYVSGSSRRADLPKTLGSANESPAACGNDA